MSPASSARDDPRANASIDDIIILWPEGQQPFAFDPTAPVFEPDDFFIPGMPVEEDQLAEAILEYLTRDTTLPEEPVMHASIERFFGDEEIVHVHGTVAELDKIKVKIAAEGKAMSRGDPVMLALDLLVQHDVAPCDCALGLGQQVAHDTDQNAEADANALPLTSPSVLSLEQSRELKTPDILVGRRFNLVAAEDETLPMLQLGSSLLHPLAGQPKPRDIPEPMEKPRGVSYAVWDNASLLDGLTDDEILGGWVHPVDLQGTLALKLAHNHKNCEIAEATTTLYERAGLEAPTKSALTYRWTHALMAQCKRDGKDFNVERKRISGLRRSPIQTVPATTTTAVAPLPGAATPSSLLALTYSQSKEASQDQTTTGQNVETTSSASIGANRVGDKMAGSGKRKRRDSTEVLEDATDQWSRSKPEATQSVAAGSHQRNASAVMLKENQAIQGQQKASTAAEDMSGPGEVEARSAKRQRINAKKAAGWRT